MKATPIRWTLGMVATEFGVDRRTVAARVKTAGVVPGEDGKFSTAQITAAIHGDIAGEKLRKLRAEADLAEIAAQTAQKERIPLSVLETGTGAIFGAIATHIKQSKLPPAVQEDIFTELRSLPEKLWGQGYALNADGTWLNRLPGAKAGDPTAAGRMDHA